MKYASGFYACALVPGGRILCHIISHLRHVGDGLQNGGGEYTLLLHPFICSKMHRALPSRSFNFYSYNWPQDPCNQVRQHLLVRCYWKQQSIVRSHQRSTTRLSEPLSNCIDTTALTISLLQLLSLANR